MSSRENSSAGTSRALLWVGVVVVLAVLAAALTVVVSSRTYSPGGRTVSPAVQVAGGSEHVDEEAGLRIRVPAGWRAVTDDLVFGSTALDREVGGETGGDGTAGGVDLVGRLTPDYGPPYEADNRTAAAMLMEGMGRYFLPIAGRVTEQRSVGISSRAGDGWAASVRVVPERPADAPAPGNPVERDGGVAYSAVVGEGTDRWWLTYIGSPGDGSASSPGVDWADAIVKRLEPTGEPPADVPAGAGGEGRPTV